MAISDTVVGNLTTLYLVLIAAMKAYGLIIGRSFGGGFVLIASTAVVAVILIGCLTWDVSRKATYALTRPDRLLNDHKHEICRGVSAGTASPSSLPPRKFGLGSRSIITYRH